jgi:hypothetical protein
MTTIPSEATSSDERSRRISWRRAFLFPFSQLLQFRKVAPLLTNAPFTALLLPFVLGIVMIGLAAGTLTLNEVQYFLGMQSTPRTLPSIGDHLMLAVLLTSLVFSVFTFAVPFFTWFQGYRSGSVLASIGLSFKAVMAQLMLWTAISILVLAIGLASFLGIHDSILAVFVAVLAAICFWMIATVTQNILSTASIETAPEILELLCESCGYNMAGSDAQSVCPECGCPIKSSLQPDTRRSGITWEATGRIADWCRASLNCLLRPDVFYRTIRLRTKLAPAIRFALLHFFVIGIGAGAWVFCMGYMTAEPDELRYVRMMSVIISCAIPIVGWLTARAVASVAGLVCFSKGLLRDGRWFAKITRYETVYLWVFCAFNGCLVTSFFIGGDWLAYLLRHVLRLRSMGFLRPVFIMGTNALLICFWFFRYRAILCAIQWSNY